MRILTTLSFLLIGISAFAQSVSLTIFNNGGQSFFVIMNGIRQNSLPQTNVKIGGMTTGAYEVKLIFADGKTGDINKKIFFESGGDYLARVDIKGKKRKLRYFGMAEGQQPTPGSTIEYRPDDQSVYSDQPQPAPPASGTVTPPPAGSTYQPQTPGTTVTTPAPTVSGTPAPGTGSGTTTTPDPMNEFGTVITSPTGTASGSTTVTTPGTTGGAVSVTTTTIDPATGQPVGGTATITIPDPNTGTVNTQAPPAPASNQQSTTFGSSVTIPDPNIPTGFGVHINIEGAEPTTVTESSTTTTSSSTTINGQTTGQTTTTVTQNGQTTTTTTNIGGTMTTSETMSDPNTTGVRYTQPYSGATICTEMLTDGDGFVNALNNQDFDADKITMVELHLKNACVTSDQAYRIVNALTFDPDKLKISKFLYVHMTDKNNGSRLLELLTFDNDKQELRKFMSTH